MLAAITVVAVLASSGCHSKACEQRVLRHHCEAGKVTACIDRAANRHGVSRVTMRRRAWCESRNTPSATNGRYMGLFQFGWVLWGQTPYRHHSPYSAKWSSLAAAWAEAHGLSSHWACR